MKRNSVVVLGLLSVMAASPLIAGTAQSHHKKNHVRFKDAAVHAANQSSGSFLDNIFNSTNRPEWMTHTYLSYAVQKHRTPITEIETTQPFYQDCWTTIFGQARLASSSGTGIGNLGLGYRILTDSNQMIWGLNAFAEETSQYSHARAGLGGEMFTPYITLRANAYHKLSATKTVSSSPGSAMYQRALNGYDISLETPFPYVSWMRFAIQGYRYVGNKTAGANGGETYLRIYPARQVEIDAGVSADNTNGRMTFLKLDYYFGSPDFIEHTMTTPNYFGAYAPVTVEKQRLQKIIRHNDIVIEKTTSGEPNSSGSVMFRGT